MAPGLRVIRLSKLRPLSGRSFTSLSPTTPESGAVVVFTSGSSSRDGHFLFEFTHFEPQVHHRLLPDLQIDSCADRCLEAFLFRLHLLWPDGQGENRVVANLVGGHGSRNSGLQALHRDGGPGHGGARCILNRARDRGGHLCLSGALT